MSIFYLISIKKIEAISILLSSNGSKWFDWTIFPKDFLVQNNFSSFLSIELINFCHLIAILFFLGGWVINLKFYFSKHCSAKNRLLTWNNSMYWRAHFMSSVVGLKWNINAHISKLDILYQLSRPAKFKIFSQKRFKCHHSVWIMSKLWWNKKIDKLFITQSN